MKKKEWTVNSPFNHFLRAMNSQENNNKKVKHIMLNDIQIKKGTKKFHFFRVLVSHTPLVAMPG